MFDCYDTLITPEEVADMLGLKTFRTISPLRMCWTITAMVCSAAG